MEESMYFNDPRKNCSHDGNRRSRRGWHGFSLRPHSRSERLDSNSKRFEIDNQVELHGGNHRCFSLGAFYTGVCGYLKDLPRILKDIYNDIAQTYAQKYGNGSYGGTGKAAGVGYPHPHDTRYETYEDRGGSPRASRVSGSSPRRGRAIQGEDELRSMRASVDMVRNEDYVQLSQGRKSRDIASMRSRVSAQTACNNVAGEGQSCIRNIDSSRWEGDVSFKGYHSIGDASDARRDTVQSFD